MSNNQNLWWGYLHINGSVQVKRYFDERDLDDAYESDFVDLVIQPFPADGRADALEKAHNKIESGQVISR